MIRVYFGSMVADEPRWREYHDAMWWDREGGYLVLKNVDGTDIAEFPPGEWTSVLLKEGADE